MGACCGGEEDSKNMNLKSKGKGRAAGNTGSFLPSGQIQDFCNDKVKETYGRMGAYDIPPLETKEKLESRDMVSLQDDGKYEGQWLKGGEQRCGAGIQVWVDGSIYEGQWNGDKADG